MTRRELRPPSAPGAVEVRLSGEQEDIDRIAALLERSGAEVLGTSGPRVNRYNPGLRMYLTVRVPGGRQS